MQKIVINRRIGGFGLSNEAEDLYAKKKGFKLFRYTRVGDYHSDKYIKEENPAEDNWTTICLTKDHGEYITYDSTKNQGWWHYGNLERDDPILVEVVEELGSDRASAKLASLAVVEIPDDIEWYIDDGFDGIEVVHENHQYW